MTVRAPTIAEQFDGTWPVGQATVRFDLTDADGNVLGTLAVERDYAPRISNDVNRSPRRQLDNVKIPPRPIQDTDATIYYAEDIDTLNMRVKPKWILPTGDEFPMGEFLWADDSAVLWSWGEPRECILSDKCVVLDQDLDANVAYDIGQNLSLALAAQADAVGINSTQRIIEATSRTISAPIAWAAGRDRRLRVFESLCALAGFLPPYFDNDGMLVCRSAPDLASATPDFIYGANTVVVAGSAVRSSDILAAPNRYVAIDTAAVDAPLVGIFDVPDIAPHSYVNRGFHVTRTIELQGLADQAAADAAAAAAYAADSSTFTWLGFSTPPDPRHDTFDVLSFDDVNYRQQAWVLDLRPEGLMTHDCRGTYA